MTWCDIFPLSSMFFGVSDALQVGLRSDLNLKFYIDFNPVWGFLKSFFSPKKMKSMQT